MAPLISCPAPFAKIFCFPIHANHLYKLAPSCPTGGALRNVINAGWDAMDASGAQDEGAGWRTAKPCGPDASTPASSLRKATFASDGDKKARSPGRARNKP